MNDLDVNAWFGQVDALGSDSRLARARELIERYDADFDVLQRRRQALGLLDVLLASVAPQTSDPRELAVLTGEAWCRLVHADVEYDLVHGLDLVGRSRSLVARLVQAEVSGDWKDFKRYVLARWHDAAGKLDFRCGDMRGATTHFEEAVRLARGPSQPPTDSNKPPSSSEENAATTGSLSCLGDLESNLLRARHDADEQVGGKTQNEALRKGYEDLLSRATRDATGPGALDLGKIRRAAYAMAEPWWKQPEGELHFPDAPQPDTGDAKQRQHLRGLSSIEHNLSIVLKALGGALLEESRIHSESSAAFAYAIADSYRFAQALRHMSNLLEPANPKRGTLAQRVMSLPWRRGHLMARQHLAIHFDAICKHDEARALLERLLSDLHEQQRERGGDLGFDVEMLRHTVKAYRDAGGSPPEVERWELTSARSLRRAVKTTHYRKRFKTDVLPLYARIIAERTKQLLETPGPEQAVEELLGLVEETSARELLDMLSARAAREGDSNAPDGSATTLPAQDAEVALVHPDVASPGVRGEAQTRDGLRDDEASRKLLAEVMRADRDIYENNALHHIAPTGEVDPDVGQALRRLTAQPGGPTVVRYFTFGEGQYAALVVRAGSIQQLVRLSSHGEPLTAKTLAAFPVGELPTREGAVWLWRTFLEPLWPAIHPGDGTELLVIIPAPGMFALPLHVASVPREAWPAGLDKASLGAESRAPLGILVPLCFTVSATAFVTRQRHLLRTQPFDPDDDLCALVPRYLDASRSFDPGELRDLPWLEDHFHLAGRPVQGAPGKPLSSGTRAGLRALLQTRAEILVFAGHGSAARVDGDAEVGLELDELLVTVDGKPPERHRTFLTQYSLLNGGRLARNKWTLLNACVSGTGADDAVRAEVAGFLKAFMAAGAGALTVTLWPVRNDAIAEVAGALLRAAASAAKSHGKVDIVSVVRDSQAAAYAKWSSAGVVGTRKSSVPSEPGAESFADDRTHACPMVVYL